jgi:hypothetical protein
MNWRWPRSNSCASLHGGESPWWIDLRTAAGSPFAVVLRSPSGRISPGMIATNAAALCCRRTAAFAGSSPVRSRSRQSRYRTPATVESVITGTGAWPAECPTVLLRAAKPRSPNSTQLSSHHSRSFRFVLDRSRSTTSPANAGSDGCRPLSCSAAPMNESMRYRSPLGRPSSFPVMSGRQHRAGRRHSSCLDRLEDRRRRKPWRGSWRAA